MSITVQILGLAGSDLALFAFTGGFERGFERGFLTAAGTRASAGPATFACGPWGLPRGRCRRAPRQRREGLFKAFWRARSSFSYAFKSLFLCFSYSLLALFCSLWVFN